MLSLYLVFSFLILFLVYLIIDYRGPKTIPLRNDSSIIADGLKAKELIIQESDHDGNLWASRGLILYCLRKNDHKFVRVAHVPTGLNFYALNHFTLFRKFSNKPECLEAVISPQGTICAMSAGHLWIRSIDGGRFRKTFSLPHFGFGVGRGILSYGFNALENGDIYWGEYFRNADRKEVRIYHSSDQGLSWNAVHEFAPGFTRHIHAVLQDPHTGRFWVCMGDHDHESRIGWSDDGFKTINYIGSGSQLWRSSHLVFTPEAVYWGTDTYSEELAGIYRWDKKSGELRHLYKSDGALLFGTALEDGTMVFSTDREGFINERDKKTRLFILDMDGHISEIEIGTWKHWKKGYRYSFAMLRFQRNQGAGHLAMSVINQEQYPAGELLIFDLEMINRMKKKKIDSEQKP